MISVLKWLNRGLGKKKLSLKVLCSDYSLSNYNGPYQHMISNHRPFTKEFSVGKGLLVEINKQEYLENKLVRALHS